MAKLAVCLTVLAALIYTATAAISTKSLAGHLITVDKYDYFSDPSATLRTQAEAKAYCKTFFGELAPVLNDKVYQTLLLRINVNGVYWIDGEPDVNPTLAGFKFDHVCAAEPINLVNANVEVTSNRCLALVKPATISATQKLRIEAIDCNTRARVLCAMRNAVC